jgi:hypothetical protein
VLEALRRHPDRSGLDVILVSVWEGSGAQEEAERFRDMWGLEGTILLDESADYTRALGIRGVPTNVFVDADGIVQAIGASTTAELYATADRLLGR